MGRVKRGRERERERKEEEKKKKKRGKRARKKRDRYRYRMVRYGIISHTATPAPQGCLPTQPSLLTTHDAVIIIKENDGKIRSIPF